MIVALVAGAGVVGALLRWRVGKLSWRPMGTFIVNLTGAFTLGLIASSSGDAQTVLGLGGLGAFTTVSGIVDDAAVMRERGRSGAANAYVLSTLILGIIAAWLGMTING